MHATIEVKYRTYTAVFMKRETTYSSGVISTQENPIPLSEKKKFLPGIISRSYVPKSVEIDNRKANRIHSRYG